MCRVKSFVADERGLVTVDLVVLTAAIVGLATLALNLVNSGAQAAAFSILEQMHLSSNSCPATTQGENVGPVTSLAGAIIPRAEIVVDDSSRTILVFGEMITYATVEDLSLGAQAYCTRDGRLIAHTSGADKNDTWTFH